jgi:hypothetical protein
MQLRLSRWVVLIVGGAGAACATTFQFHENRPPATECRTPNWCVTGTVMDDSSGAPIAGSQVIINHTPCGAVADSTGRFTLVCSVVPGDSLVARGIGYVTLRRAVTIIHGRHYVARIRLQRARAVGPIF